MQDNRYVPLQTVARFETALRLVRENRIRGRLDSFNRWWVAEREIARYEAAPRDPCRARACVDDRRWRGAA
jgi:hypothetical protein